jgi:hypothetical protein
MWEMCAGIVMVESKSPEDIELLRKRQRGGREWKGEKGERDEGRREGRELKIVTEKDASNRELSAGLISNVVLSLMIKRSLWLIKEHD